MFWSCAAEGPAGTVLYSLRINNATQVGFYVDVALAAAPRKAQ